MVGWLASTKCLGRQVLEWIRVAILSHEELVERSNSALLITYKTTHFRYPLKATETNMTTLN